MTTTEAKLARCASCNAELDFPLFCASCRKLHPLPERTDYFALLRIKRGYDIDEQVLRSKLLSLSRSIHPDFFGGESQPMRELAVRLSAEVNEAAKVLLDPVLRAAYLLKLSGGAPDAGRRAVCPEVLGEVMILREELEEATASGDNEALDRVCAQARDRREGILGGIGELARKLPDASGEERSRLQTLLSSVSYYDNLLEVSEET